MHNRHQHNFSWAWQILNVTPPAFINCNFEQATKILQDFKAMAKTKFRKVILIKHVDKGGSKQLTQNLIKANTIIKQAEVGQDIIAGDYHKNTRFKYLEKSSVTQNYERFTALRVAGDEELVKILRAARVSFEARKPCQGRTAVSLHLGCTL